MLPNAIEEVLSYESLAQRSYEDAPSLVPRKSGKTYAPGKTVSRTTIPVIQSIPIVTPVRSSNAEFSPVIDETYYYRSGFSSGFSDDFDLFDGQLLRATDDEVLKNVHV